MFLFLPILVNWRVWGVSGGVWLQFGMVVGIKSWVFGKLVFDPQSDDGFRHSWQGPFFSRNNTSLDFGTCFCDFALIPGHEKDVERHLEKGTPSFSP